MKYHQIKIVGDETTLQASTISLGKFVKKYDVLSIKKE
jgi:hypothetical protein